MFTIISVCLFKIIKYMKRYLINSILKYSIYLINYLIHGFCYFIKLKFLSLMIFKSTIMYYLFINSLYF